MSLNREHKIEQQNLDNFETAFNNFLTDVTIHIMKNDKDVNKKENINKIEALLTKYKKTFSVPDSNGQLFANKLIIQDIPSNVLLIILDLMDKIDIPFSDPNFPYNNLVFSASQLVNKFDTELAKQNQRSILTWFLKEKRYEKLNCNLSLKHIKAALGDYIPDQNDDEDLTDSLGLTPFHFLICSGRCLLTKGLDELSNDDKMKIDNLPHSTDLTKKITNGVFAGTSLAGFFALAKMSKLLLIIMEERSKKFFGIANFLKKYLGIEQNNFYKINLNEPIKCLNGPYNDETIAMLLVHFKQEKFLKPLLQFASEPINPTIPYNNLYNFEKGIAPNLTTLVANLKLIDLLIAMLKHSKLPIDFNALCYDEDCGRVTLAWYLADEGGTSNLDLIEEIRNRDPKQIIDLEAKAIGSSHFQNGETLSLAIAFQENWEIFEKWLDLYNKPVNINASFENKDNLNYNLSLLSLLLLNKKYELIRKILQRNPTQRLNLSAKCVQECLNTMDDHELKKTLLSLDKDTPKIKEEIQAISTLEKINIQLKTLEPLFKQNEIDVKPTTTSTKNFKITFTGKQSARDFHQLMKSQIEKFRIGCNLETNTMKGGIFAFSIITTETIFLNFLIKPTIKNAISSFLDKNNSLPNLIIDTAVKLTPVEIKEEEEIKTWQSFILKTFSQAKEIQINWDKNQKKFIIDIDSDRTNEKISWTILPYKEEQKEKKFKTFNLPKNILAQQIVARIQEQLQNKMNIAIVEIEDDLQISITPCISAANLSNFSCQKIADDTFDYLTKLYQQPKIVVKPVSATNEDTQPQKSSQENISELSKQTILDGEEVKALFKFITSNELKFVNIKALKKNGNKWELNFNYYGKGKPFLSRAAGKVDAADFFDVLKKTINHSADDNCMKTYPPKTGNVFKIVVNFNQTSFDALSNKREEIKKTFETQDINILPEISTTDENFVKIQKEEQSPSQPTKSKKAPKEIRNLDDVNLENLIYHLTQLKLIPKPEPKSDNQDFYYHVYLMHALQAFEILSEGKDEKHNIFYQWRTVIRRAYDELEWESFHKLVQPFMDALFNFDIIEKRVSSTNNTSFFSAKQKPTAFDIASLYLELEAKLGPFRKQLDEGTIGKGRKPNRSKEAYETLLREIAKLREVAKSQLDTQWGLDATLMIHSILGQKDPDRTSTSSHIYGEVGHEITKSKMHYLEYTNILNKRYKLKFILDDNKEQDRPNPKFMRF